MEVKVFEGVELAVLWLGNVWLGFYLLGRGTSEFIIPLRDLKKLLAFSICLVFVSCDYRNDTPKFNVFCHKVIVNGEQLVRTGYLNDQECCIIGNVFLKIDSTQILNVIKTNKFYPSNIANYKYSLGQYRVYKIEGFKGSDIYIFVKDGLIDGIALERMDGIYLRYYTMECFKFLREEGSIETFTFFDYGCLDSDSQNLSSCGDSAIIIY